MTNRQALRKSKIKNSSLIPECCSLSCTRLDSWRCDRVKASSFATDCGNICTYHVNTRKESKKSGFVHSRTAQQGKSRIEKDKKRHLCERVREGVYLDCLTGHLRRLTTGFSFEGVLAGSGLLSTFFVFDADVFGARFGRIGLCNTLMVISYGFPCGWISKRMVKKCKCARENS